MEKIRVLVIDDDQYIRELVARILENEGFAVTVAANGESALALLSEIRPDIILLDIRMPGMDGYQVLERVRKTSDVPVLMLTGVPEESAVVNSLNLGADDYIRKPFLPSVLAARVRANSEEPKTIAKRKNLKEDAKASAEVGRAVKNALPLLPSQPS